MNWYFALCDGQETHVVQLGRQEAIRELGSEVVHELDEGLPPSTKPLVPAKHCPDCREQTQRSSMHYLRKYGIRAWFAFLAALCLTEPLWWPDEPKSQKVWIPVLGAIVLVLALRPSRHGKTPGRSK